MHIQAMTSPTETEIRYGAKQRYASVFIPVWNLSCIPVPIVPVSTDPAKVCVNGMGFVIYSKGNSLPSGEQQVLVPVGKLRR